MELTPEQEAYRQLHLEKIRNREYVCSICKVTAKGYGNNPWPVKSEGECCDGCNLNIVLTHRQLKWSK